MRRRANEAMSRCLSINSLVVWDWTNQSRPMIRLFFCFFILQFLSLPATSQPGMLSNGEQLSVHSRLLDEERSLFIHTPSAYSHSGTPYPVLIALDGEWSFRNAVAITEHLAASERMPPMIVVGIPNTIRNGRPTRFIDLTPAGPGGQNTTSGGAEAFLRFITDEMLPFIEERYNTSSYRALVGHSLGGLFTVYAMLQTPEAFDAYFAISPSLGRNNQQQVQRALHLYSKGVAYPGAFHLSIGNEGGNTMLGVEAFAEVLKAHTAEEFRWKFEAYDEEDHVSVVYRSLYDALEWTYEGWTVPEYLLADNDISIVERHYHALSKRLGVEVSVPEHYYTRLGYRILGEQDFDYAAWTFQQYHEAYPGSSRALVGLGDSELMRGELEKASAYYKQALDLNPHDERASHMQKALH